MKYDAIIIGAGQAGVPLARKFAKRGWTVAVAEGNKLGGSCVNYGCTPSKTLIASARAAYMARRGPDFGVQSGKIRIDFKTVMKRVHKVVENSRSGIESSFNDLENVTLYREYASFESATRVRVGKEVIEAPRIFINTGSRAAMPDIPGLDLVDPLDNVSILDLEAVPKRLVVIGGGYVGVEYAQAFQRLGSDVTIVDHGGQLLSHEDADIAEHVKGILENEGVRVILNAKVTRLKKTANGVSVSLKGDDVPKTVSGTHVLAALGRVPNTDRLNLEAAGLETDDDGFIPVDGQMRTKVDGIWALGDVNGRGAFTHTSWDDHLAALAGIDGGEKTADGRPTIYAVYCDPPLGRVGIGEAEARESGKNVQMATMPMSSVSRAIERDETQGMMKVLVDADTKQFLGAALLGIGGDEVIHTIADQMYAQAPYTVIENGVHIHPTVTELLPSLLGKLKPLD